jgi:acetyltransferase-like isoleucine patch superfamily enzyme
MKLVDNKGRFFGVINLIDLMAILLMAWAAISVITNLSGTTKHLKTTQEVYINVLCHVPSEVASNKSILLPGDVILGGNARIEKVLEMRPVKDANGKDAGSSVVVVRIKANCAILNGEYFCTNVPIKINSNIVFSSPLYMITNATIIDVDTRTGDKR